MLSKKKLLKDSLLCVILDRDILKGKALIAVARKALRAGADMLQLRSKHSSTEEALETASALKALTRCYGVPLIINDRVDIAAAVDSDGVHIGQADLRVGTARKILGSGKLIGVTAAGLAEAKRAKEEGADYIGVGPVFKTPIKASKRAIGVEALKKIRNLRIPIIAIGGIDCKNISGLAQNGFKRVAVIRAVCSSRETLSSTRKLKEAII
ncbi:MAG: thiamine phosphate synthase [Candidatus Omnitrophica bacterium]|nr:thiamine phosphate synthase [Candidatus Omnitrophota bacterium]